MTQPDSWRMTPREKQSSLSLAGIFALRMLGLFVILPVFAIYARELPGGEDALAVGLALGVYGLTQGLLQIPFGAASDRIGRRPVIAAGLVFFAIGSFSAACADSITGVILGRALQGAGAISAAVTALISDSVRERVITKAMAMVGASIGLTFALSLVIAPPLARLWGVPGIFALTGVLAAVALLVLWKLVPEAPRPHPDEHPHASWTRIAADPQLLRLNFSIFALHAALTAMFVVVPTRLTALGLEPPEHWMAYLPAVLAGFAVMAPVIIRSERAGRVAAAVRVTSGCLAAVLVLFALQPNSVWAAGILLALFFACFNVLEATLPGLVSRSSPKSGKGLALGIFNTTQNLGLFAGGALGGIIARSFGPEAVFLACAFAMLSGLASAIGLREPARSRP